MRYEQKWRTSSSGRRSGIRRVRTREISVFVILMARKLEHKRLASSKHFTSEIAISMKNASGCESPRPLRDVNNWWADDFNCFSLLGLAWKQLMVDFLRPLRYLHSRLLFFYSPTFQQFFNHISSARRRINGRRGNGFSWKLPSTQTIISLRRRIIPRLKHHHRGIRRWWLIARVSDEEISINYIWDARFDIPRLLCSMPFA